MAAAPALTRAVLAMTPDPQALLDPAALPVDPATCLPVYPHSYLKVNTVFEVARAHGLRTAWSDKHPAYEILSGPSGTGIQDLFTPEVNSVADAAGDVWTKDNLLTQESDGFKVAAVLNEINGRDHSGTRSVGTPAVFGMNFQTVSTAQKLPVSDGLTGGYLPGGAPGPLLTRSLDYVDGQVAAMTAAVDRRGLAASTTIILSAKHGQSPTAPSALRRVDDTPIIAGIDAGWAARHPAAKPLVAFFGFGLADAAALGLPCGPAAAPQPTPPASRPAPAGHMELGDRRCAIINTVRASDVTAGAVLRQARTRAGLTQRELARRAGVSQSVVAAYESASRQPSLATLAALVEAGGISLDLALGADVPAPLRTGPIGHRLQRRRAAVLELAARHRITDLQVFGSVARGEDGPHSDLDLLVHLPDDAGLFLLGRFSEELSTLLGVDVDVVPDDSLKPRIRARVERDLRPL